MTRGKQTCRILKEIRRQIAEANGIEFATSECRYKGDCRGTCPKCEAELRYLEQQLRARSLSGRAVALAGISAGMLLMSGCGGKSPAGTDGNGPAEAVADTIAVQVVDNVEQGDIALAEDTVAVENNRVEISELLIVGEEDLEDIPEDREVVDEWPCMPDGYPGLQQWLEQNIRYPQSAIDADIQGYVFVKALVREDGSVGDIEISKSRDEALDKEALRVVGLLPSLKPAMKDGKPVECWYTISVPFWLNDTVSPAQ